MGEYSKKSISAVVVAVGKAKKATNESDKKETLALIVKNKDKILKSKDSISEINTLVENSSKIKGKTAVTIKEYEVKTLEDASSKEKEVATSSNNGNSAANSPLRDKTTKVYTSGSDAKKIVNDRVVPGISVINLKATVSASVDGGTTKLVLEGDHNFKQTIDPNNFKIMHNLEEISTGNFDLNVKRNNPKELLFTISSTSPIKHNKYFYISMSTEQIQGYASIGTVSSNYTTPVDVEILLEQKVVLLL